MQSVVSFALHWKFAIATDFFDVISMQMVMGYTLPSVDAAVNEFMFDLGLSFAIIIPVTQQQFRDMASQPHAEDDVIIVPDNYLPVPSMN